LQQDKIPGKKLLFVAKDIERSLLELAYFEIVKTTDPGYEKILKEILTQTAEHKKRMEQKIAAIPLPR
jgi:bacterioferritin (cytochrome b1)